METNVNKEAALLLRKGAEWWSTPEKHATGTISRGTPTAPDSLCSVGNIYFQSRGTADVAPETKYTEAEKVAMKAVLEAAGRTHSSTSLTDELCTLNNGQGFAMKGYFEAAATALEKQAA